MRTITVPAIYRNGMIEPQVKLDLPDNTLVQVNVTIPDEPLDTSDELIHSLYGKYAEGPSLLAALMRERAIERTREDAQSYRTQTLSQNDNE